MEFTSQQLNRTDEHFKWKCHRLFIIQQYLSLFSMTDPVSGDGAERSGAGRSRSPIPNLNLSTLSSTDIVKHVHAKERKHRGAKFIKKVKECQNLCIYSRPLDFNWDLLAADYNLLAHNSTTTTTTNF